MGSLKISVAKPSQERELDSEVEADCWKAVLSYEAVSFHAIRTPTAHWPQSHAIISRVHLH